MRSRGLRRDLDEVLDHAGDALTALVDARILLTGATGFVGRWALEALVHARDRCRGSGELLVLTRRPAQFRAAAPRLAGHPAVVVVEGDARTYIPPAGSLDLVVAGAAPAGAADPEATSVIVEGTRRALELSSYHGSRLFLVSSGAARSASTPFGTAKRRAEHEAALSGVDYVVARLHSFIGPHQSGPHEPSMFLADTLAGRPIRVHGDGTALRSYLYAGDLAAWFWTLAHRGADGVVYDVGSPEAVTVAELACRVARLGGDSRVLLDGTGPESETPACQAPDPSFPDTTPAEHLGLDAWTGLDAALARTWRWLGGRTLAAA